MLDTSWNTGPGPGNAVDPEAALHFEGVVQKFADFYEDLTESSVRTKIEQTYHPDVVFDDTLHKLQGREALTRYMISTAQGVHSTRVRILDAAPGAEGAVYVRWEMTMELKRLAKGRTLTSTGMTHLHAAEDGRIVFHHDYWDAAGGLFEHFPVLGPVIRWIKSRIG